MFNFTPDSFLLNNVYFPFYNRPKKTIFNAENQLVIETGINQTQSVISIKEDDKEVIPFIDLSRYDSETRSWFWYDEEDFPLRIVKNGDTWQLVSIYPVSRYYGKTIIFDPNSLEYNKYNVGKNLGWYSIINTLNGEDVSSQKLKIYNGNPFILTINSLPLTDLTDYYKFKNDLSLINFKTSDNKEFFYNTQLNRLYTNQNLNSFDVSNIEFYFFRNIQSIKVKIALSSNTGMSSYTTPTVDYYIAKLHGQYLKG
jgi:hypothetical protein